MPSSYSTSSLYLEIILYSVGGVVGTMHHLYFSGAPAVHMSVGAFFSAMEVIPFVLLEWLRLAGDIVFIAFGILPLVYLAVRMVGHRNRPEPCRPKTRVPLLSRP